jgi:hypothetical protein
MAHCGLLALGGRDRNRSSSHTWGLSSLIFGGGIDIIFGRDRKKGNGRNEERQRKRAGDGQFAVSIRSGRPGPAFRDPCGSVLHGSRLPGKRPALRAIAQLQVMGHVIIDQITERNKLVVGYLKHDYR